MQQQEQSIYDWCTALGNRHFREIVAKYDGKLVCRECLSILKKKGRKQDIKIVEKEIIEAPKNKTRKRKIKAHSRTKRSRAVLKKRVLEYLKTGFYTQLDIYKNVRHGRSSEQIKYLLSRMRKAGEIVCDRRSPYDPMLYTTPERMQALKSHLGDTSIDSVLEVLQASIDGLTTNQIASILDRPKPTITRWVNILEAQGKIKTEVKHLGGRGRSRVCWIVNANPH